MLLKCAVRAVQKSFISNRSLHACWSVLLSHDWVYCDSLLEENGSAGITIETEPKENKATILILHDTNSNRTHSCALATMLLERAPVDFRNHIQCLCVDVRGHGESDGDDYDSPHTIQSVTGDIVDLISSVCTGGISQPRMILGVGSLGSSIAVNYLANAINPSSSSSISHHSEVSGEGLIAPPAHTVMLDNSCYQKLQIDYSNLPDCDKAIAEALKAAARAYMDKNSLLRVLDTIQASPNASNYKLSNIKLKTNRNSALQHSIVTQYSLSSTEDVFAELLQLKII